MTEPFMEHPDGDFNNAEAAMADAVRRLRELPQWDEWITFCAQGMGNRTDGYHFAEVRLRNDELLVELDLDAGQIAEQANVAASCFEKLGDNYSLKQATPDEAARILDTIFRQHMGIRSHDDQAGDDYAVGAEWESGTIDPIPEERVSLEAKRPWWRFW